MLFVDQNDGPSALLAVSIYTPEGNRGRTSIYWLPQAASAGERGRMLNFVSLEQLYAMTLAADAEGAFRFHGGTALVNEGSTAASHAEALRAIASTRECAAVELRAQPSDSIVRWQVVSLAPHQPADYSDSELVAIRVTSASAPVIGAQVAFARAPHSGCFATSGADGVAACTLNDLHGHEKHSDEVHKTPVVATFRGVVMPGHIQLPTTLVVDQDALSDTSNE